MSHLSNEALNKALFAAALAIFAAIVLATVAALALGKRPGREYRRADPKTIFELRDDGPKSEFKEFGTLRARLLPDKKQGEAGSVLVVTPWLLCQSDDSAFYEELLLKKKLFSSYITEYFSGKTKNALLSAGEKRVKKELLEKINSQLSLGKIDAIYFDDYFFLD